MKEVYATRGASLHKINLLADWIRVNVANVANNKLDVIRFVELDLPRFFPGLYLSIEADLDMGRVKARISDNPFGIVVAESVYERASNGCLDAAETILHEVGHLFLHDEYKSLGLNDAFGQYEERIRDTNPANSAEWQAKAFAKCFLFPYGLADIYSRSIELQIYLDLNVERSRDALNHWKTLKLRESQRSQRAEASWLKDVLKPLTDRKLPNQNQRKEGQLELFYRTEQLA